MPTTSRAAPEPAPLPGQLRSATARGTAGAGVTDSHPYTHPGLLAGLENAWGLPLLNAAQTATPLPIS